MQFIETIAKADTDLFLFLNQFHNTFFDGIMKTISAKYTWIPLYLIILISIFKKFKFKTGFIILLSFIGLIILSDQTSVHLIKNVFQRLRPCYNLEIQHVTHYLSLAGSKYGFVSSHASNSFAFAVFSLLLFKKKWYTFLILTWAIVVSYSRIYLGVHYPLDVVFGAILGTVLAGLIYSIIKPKTEFNQRI